MTQKCTFQVAYRPTSGHLKRKKFTTLKNARKFALSKSHSAASLTDIVRHCKGKGSRTNNILVAACYRGTCHTSGTSLSSRLDELSATRGARRKPAQGRKTRGHKRKKR